MAQKDLLTDRDIDRLFYTTADMIYETDMQHGDGRNYWPFHPVILDSIVAPYVFDELHRLFKLLENKGCSVEKIAKLMKSPTKIANYQFLWSGGAKTIKKMSEEKKYYLASMFTKMLRVLRHNEPFCENFRNPVWSDKEVKSYLKQNEKKFFVIKNQPKTGKLLAKIEGLLMSYCELLYYYMLDFSRMFHGPYVYGGKTIFAKEFLDLRAEGMWDLVSEFPFNDFREVGVYPEKMDIQVFFMGHTHVYPSFPGALKKFGVEIDGKLVTKASELQKCYTDVDKVVSKAVVEMTKRKDNEEFLLKRGIDLFFYPLKSLYDEAGESWAKILPQVYKFAKKIRPKIKVPPPWGDWSRTRAARYLMKQMEFRERA